MIKTKREYGTPYGFVFSEGKRFKCKQVRQKTTKKADSPRRLAVVDYLLALKCGSETVGVLDCKRRIMLRPRSYTTVINSKTDRRNPEGGAIQIPIIIFELITESMRF